MRSDKERGNILVMALLMLVTMNLVGIGIVQLSAKENNLAQFKSIDSEVFHITDSCSQDVIKYFEGLTATPEQVDIPAFSQDNIENMFNDTESDKVTNKLSGYSYNCAVTYILSKSETTGTGTGGEVGDAGSGYGSESGLALKDYYQIVASGNGPKSSTKTINTIISVEY